MLLSSALQTIRPVTSSPAKYFTMFSAAIRAQLYAESRVVGVDFQRRRDRQYDRFFREINDPEIRGHAVCPF
jgi:hypothetical protein